MQTRKTFAILLAIFFTSVSVAQPLSTPVPEDKPLQAKVAPPPLPEGVVAHYDLQYVTHGSVQQTLDLYRPEIGNNFPLIVWIHGGAWLSGSKEYGVPISYLTQGYAVASINYRLSTEAIFPAQIEDCKAAVRWLRANAAHYALDAERFAAWGSSAGGHLAALLGTTGDLNIFNVGEHLNISSRVKAVVDYYGPTDFLQMDAYRTPDGTLHDVANSPESQLIGGPLQENKEKVLAANPIIYISEKDPAFFIVHGNLDPKVPYHQSQILYRALIEAGIPVKFYTVEGGGHGGFIDPQVDAITRKFLADTLKPNAI